MTALLNIDHPLCQTSAITFVGIGFPKEDNIDMCTKPWCFDFDEDQWTVFWMYIYGVFWENPNCSILVWFDHKCRCVS